MIKANEVSCCLITKEERYPKEILNEIQKIDFGEILILTHSDSPFRKHELFNKAKFDYIYYQDDDALCPIEQLLTLSDGAIINVAMKPGHIEAHKNTRMTMGLGWGSIFPKSCLKSLDKYREKYGEDFIFKRETERILTYLNYPQNRLDLPIQDLPSAWLPDRLCFQPMHYDYRQMVEERCRPLI